MKKERLTTLLLILVFLAGLSLLLYPAVSNWWNERLQAQVIVKYDNSLTELEQERYSEILSQARDFNARLAAGEQTSDPDLYEEMLDPFSTGVMGYIEIPSIGCKLPVAHGTSDTVLRDSVGHLEWTSLPVGGESTHSVLSGHRGLPSAELLTNIDHLEVGDRFTLHILNMELTYQVDQIRVVEPSDASLLQIEEGQDYVTLLTCTPYGINSHRLLVRGARVYTDESAALSAPDVRNEAETVSPVYWLPPALVALGAAGGALYLAGSAAKKTWKNKHTADEHGEAYEIR